MTLRNFFRRRGAELARPTGPDVPYSDEKYRAAPPRDTGIHPLLPEAVAHHQAGRLQQAGEMYELILRDAPTQFDAAHLLGVVAMQQGRLDDAQRQIRFALTIKPNDQAALINLTAVYLRTGQLGLAAESGEAAARLIPVSIDAMINYGTVLYQLGRYREAIEPLEIARNMHPGSTIVSNLLGTCLMKSGDSSQAATIFEQVTVQAPEDSDGWANLSAALTMLSEHDRAMVCANRAVELSLDSSNALAAQAAAQFELGKIEESIATYEKAVALKPTVMILCRLAVALITSGRPDDALPYLRQAGAIDGSNPYVRLLSAVSELKPIYRNEADLQISRSSFERAITELQAWSSPQPMATAFSAVGTAQPFFLAYHPYNNRPLLSRYGALCARWMMTLPGSDTTPGGRSRNAKFRIGIVSAHVRNQSVWNAILKGWVHQLDKSRFDIFLFKLGTQRDGETAAARTQVHHFDDAQKSLPDWVATIRNAGLDALIYDEIGMNALTLQLAAMRLAPIQAVTWGHPETTGLPTIDYYLSASGLEPPNAQENYSESLVLLPHMGVHVEMLTPDAQDPDLQMLGLPCDEPLLLCPGSPFKYSPLHDRVWIEIAKGLKAHAAGRLIFFAASSGTMHVQLIGRLREAFSEERLDFNSHVCVIPFLSRRRYFGLMQRSTLMLDTLDFSGFNTAIQAVECGLPYLAYEGKFMRGRLASCIMRRLDLPELVATTYQEFAERAVALTFSEGRLRSLRTEIRERRGILFEDSAPVRALEEFLATEIVKRRSGVTGGHARFTESPRA